MWRYRKKSVDIVPILRIFSDIGGHLHYTKKFLSIFLIYRNLSEAKYGKDLHWVEEWDKTSEVRHVLSAPFTTIAFVQPFLPYRRSPCSLSSIDRIVREGKRRGCAFPFPGNFRNGTWSIMKLFLSLSPSPFLDFPARVMQHSHFFVNDLIHVRRWRSECRYGEEERELSIFRLSAG